MRAQPARAHDRDGSSTDTAEEITMTTVTLLDAFEGGIR